MLDIDPALRTVSGRLALIQAVYRRLTTPRGALVDWPSYGFDLQSIIGTTLSIVQVTSRVREQCMAEEEVLDVLIDIEQSRDRRTLTIDLRITDRDGPFTLTLNVSELGVEAIIPEAA